MIEVPSAHELVEIAATVPDLDVTDDDRKAAAETNEMLGDAFGQATPEEHAFMRTWLLAGWSQIPADAEALAARHNPHNCVLFHSKSKGSYAYFRLSAWDWHTKTLR